MSALVERSPEGSDWRVHEPLWRDDARLFEVASAPLGPGAPRAALAKAIDSARGGNVFQEESSVTLDLAGVIGAFCDLRSGAGAALSEMVESGEKIVVFGDYDVDGVSSAVITAAGLAAARLGADRTLDLWRHDGLKTAFDAAGIVCVVPERSDGYGISIRWIERFVAGSYRRVVCCDNGSNAMAVMRLAASYDVGLIVFDHHPLSQASQVFWSQAPRGFAISNPWMADALGDLLRGWPGRVEVCAATVALAGVLELLSRRGVWDDVFVQQLAILAGVASVTDMMPVRGVNRVLVKSSLSALDQGYGPSGLLAIRDQSFERRKIDLLRLSSSDDAEARWWKCALDGGFYGFHLGPRLNSCGRMGQAKTAIGLLAVGEAQAKGLAANLETINDLRREREAVAVQRAIEIAKGAMIEAEWAGFDNDIAGLALDVAEGRKSGADVAKLIGLALEIAPQGASFSQLACGVPGLFVFYADPDLASGLAGLVATKLAEEFGCPAMAIGGTVFEAGTAFWSGSGRCPEDALLRLAQVDVAGAVVTAAGNLGGGGGGHAAAFGLRLPARADVEEGSVLARRFAADFAWMVLRALGLAIRGGLVIISDEEEVERDRIDLAFSSAEAALSAARALASLGPFGREFEEPRMFFPIAGATVKPLGKQGGSFELGSGSLGADMRLVGFGNQFGGGLENDRMRDALTSLEGGSAGLIGTMARSFFGKGRFGRAQPGWQGPKLEFRIEAIVKADGA